MTPASDLPRWFPWMIIGLFVMKLAVVTASLPDRDPPLAARALALAGGRVDASGRAAPLLVHDGGERWYQPLAVYPAALLIRVGVPARTAMRLPAMLAAGISALLTYMLGVRLLRRSRMGGIALLFLVASPAWVGFGATSGADFVMVATILGWLVSVLGWRDRPSLMTAAVSGLLLGLSAWTQPAGVLAVPLFFAVGWLLMTDRQRRLPVVAAAAFGAAIPVIVCGGWLAMHPDAYADTFGRWAIHAAHVRRPWQGVIAVTKWDVMARRAAEYWAYVSPTYLFDGQSLFSVGMLGFVAAGLWAALDAGNRAVALAVGFLAVPLAAVLLDSPRDASLVLMMAPLGALVGALGVECVLERRGGRPVAFVLMAIVIASGALAGLIG